MQVLVRVSDSQPPVDLINLPPLVSPRTPADPGAHIVPAGGVGRPARPSDAPGPDLDPTATALAAGHPRPRAAHLRRL